MRVVITGGAGFLGRKLGEALAQRGWLTGADGAKRTIEKIALLDRAEPETPPQDGRFEIAVGDVAEPGVLARVLAPGADAIFHLAAIVSGEAEQDFDLGLRVNLDGTRALLDLCRALPAPPRFVFTSSIGAFGGDLPAVIDDTTPLNPQTSYGNQKAACEFLLKDWNRRGFVDGRAVRLPTIVARPGKPNKAASGFASSVIREPLMGRDYVCPVPPETRMWMLSPRRVVAAMIHAHETPAESWGNDRVVNLPGLSVSMSEALEAVRRFRGDEAAARVRFEPDPGILKFVDGWPKAFATPRALALGFEADAGVDEIIRTFIEDELREK